MFLTYFDMWESFVENEYTYVIRPTTMEKLIVIIHVTTRTTDGPPLKRIEIGSWLKWSGLTYIQIWR